MPKQKYIMTPEHKNWDKFANALSGPGYCDFQDKPKFTWKCKHDHTFARKLLQKMGADVEQSIEYFRAHGGYCDCEILFNVDTKASTEVESKLEAAPKVFKFKMPKSSQIMEVSSANTVEDYLRIVPELRTGKHCLLDIYKGVLISRYTVKGQRHLFLYALDSLSNTLIDIAHREWETRNSKYCAKSSGEGRQEYERLAYKDIKEHNRWAESIYGTKECRKLINSLIIK